MTEDLNGNKHQPPKHGGRIRIDKVYHDTYAELTKSQEGGGRAPFESMKNLFMLAAFVGYQMKKRVPLDSYTDFNWQALNDNQYSPLLRALALSETGDVKVLKDNSTILNIIEEYANAGIEIIQQQVENMSGDKVMNLVDLLANWEPYKS